MVETNPLQTNHLFYIPRPARLAQSFKARLLPPKIESETVCQVLKHYGLELSKSPRNLPFGRRNRIVVVHTSEGKKVLRAYKTMWHVPAIVYEHSIIAYLEQLNFPAPRLVEALNGETLVSECNQRFALCDYVDGTAIASSFVTQAHRRKLLAVAGKTLAQFHRHLEGFLPQGQHNLGHKSYSEDRWRDLDWHINVLKRLSEESRDRIKSEESIQMERLLEKVSYVQERLAQLDATLQQVQLPRSVIHGDYGIHNLKFHRNGTATVYDFELARLEWRLTDIVIVLSRIGFDRGRYFMTGYRSEYPLSHEEWHYLPQVWEQYKLQGAIQSLYTFSEVGGSHRLATARERIGQAEHAATPAHHAQLTKLHRLTEELS